MANDVNANIRINIDSAEALSQLRALQSQISGFNQSIIQTNSAAVAKQRDLLTTLQSQIGATKQFSTSIVGVESTVSRLGRAIDKNKLSLGEYFRFGVASSKRFGRVFGKEHALMTQLATERVKKLQTQYVALGAAQNGVTKAMAIRPLQAFNADAAIAIQRSQLFNKLLQDGSTSLVNFGKNTQWAGRQLMVGFTVPLTIFGGAASKVFMDLEEQAINFRKVYGDIFTTDEEVEENLSAVRELSEEFTKYGIAAKDTLALAGIAAQSGQRGQELMAATTEATRLGVLGQMDQAEAMKTTITLQNAFKLSSEELTESINFLNVVENQSVLSLQDVAGAIPRVAPVIYSLGGNVQDLAAMLVAMREGGVSAAEGANALKTSLSRLISPTAGAVSMAKELGIDLNAIVESNQGDIMGAVMQLADSMERLDGLAKQRLLSEVFGKRQYARVGALFNNITDSASQAQRVIGLTAMSTEELAETTQRELDAVSDNISTKFTGAIERLKIQLAPIGELFLQIATPVVEFATKALAKFNELSPTVKKFATIATVAFGVVTPVLIMLVGLVANFIGNMVKGLSLALNFINRARGAGAAAEYLSGEQLEATAAAASLEGRTDMLTSSLNIQRSAVLNLARAYQTYVGSATAAAAGLPRGFRGPVRRMARGGKVGGQGNRDSEPALLMPGEFVMNKKAAEKYAPILSAMNQGSIKGYADGSDPIVSNLYSEIMMRLQPGGENTARRSSLPGVEDILSPLSLRMGEARGMKPTETQVLGGAFDEISAELEDMAEEFVGRMGVHFDDTYSAIEDSDERLKRAWMDAGLEMEDSLSRFSTEAERTMARRYMGLEEDVYGTIATDVRKKEDTKLTRARKGTKSLRGGAEVRSYTTLGRPARLLRERRTGESSYGLQMGHVNEPRPVTKSQFEALAAEPGASGSLVKAAKQKKYDANIAGKTTGEALNDGAEQAIGAASPAQDGVDLVNDYVDGMLLGAQQNAGQATQAGALLNDAFNMGAQGPTSPYMGPPGQGPSSPYTVLGDETMEQLGAAGAAANRGEGLFGEQPRGERMDINTREIIPSDLGDELDDIDKKTKKTRKGFKGMGKAAIGAGAALTVAAGAASMMPGPLGETAQQFFPLIIGLEGVLSILPLVAGAGGFGGLASSLGSVGGAAAMLLNPFTLIAAAIAAIVAALVVALKRSEAFRQVFIDLFNTLKEAVSPFIGSVETLGERTGSVLGFISSLWNTFVGVVSVNVSIVVKAIEMVIKIITMARNIFWGVIGALINFIGSLGPVGAAIKNVFDGLRNFFSNIPSLARKALLNVTKFIDKMVNNAIDGLNKLINAYNEVASRLGVDTIKPIENINLTVTVLQATGMRGSGSDVLSNREAEKERARETARDSFRQEPLAVEEEEDTETTGAGSAKEKTFLEKLEEDLKANAKLYLNAQKGLKGYMKNRGNFFGVFQKLRRKGVSEDIIAALGTGPEAIKNARELLKMGKKELKQLMKDAELVSVGQVVENARRQAIADEQKLKATRKTSGLSPELQDIILADTELTKAFATTKKGTPEYERLMKVVNRLAKAKKNLAEASKTEADKQQDAIDAMDEARQPLLDDFARREALFQAEFGQIERHWQPIIAANEKQIDLLQEQIDAVQEEIDEIDKLNEADERRIRGLERQKEMLSRQIEVLQRQNEMDKRRIEQLNREDELRNRVAEGLEKELENMDRQETKIRDMYEERFKALDKIAQVNDYIISQQQRQVGLSKALAEGDIFAAAEAAQQMRAESAQFSREQTRAGLEAGMERQVEGLRTEGGLTREQAEEKIRQIQEQSYQTSLKIREIEDLIYQRNLEMIPLKDQQYNLDKQIQGIQDIIYGRETQILDIQTSRLAPLQSQLNAQQKSLSNNQKALANAKAAVRIEGQTYDELQNQISAEKEAYDVSVALIKAGGDQRRSVENVRKKWVEVTNQIAAAVKTARQLKEEAEMGARERFDEIEMAAIEGRITADEAERRKSVAAQAREETLAQIVAQREADISAAMQSGIGAIRMAAGGMVKPKGYRGGGIVSGMQSLYTGGVVGDGARDSVPAMLTPGEFVVRKSMVRKYGEGMLKDINMGSFTVPKYSMANAPATPSPVQSSYSSSVNMPVYNNYDMNFTINGTNADAEDIARQVMFKIKTMQGSQVRGNRV